MAQYGTTDRCTGGTPSVHNATNGSAANVFDDDTGTYFEGTPSATGWIKYDFGAGTTWAISKVLYARRTGVANGINAYSIQGSNNDSDWDVLDTGNYTNTDGDQTATFTNRIPYRYMRIVATSAYDGSFISAREVSMYEGIYPGVGVGIGSPMMI